MRSWTLLRAANKLLMLLNQPATLRAPDWWKLTHFNNYTEYCCRIEKRIVCVRRHTSDPIYRIAGIFRGGLIFAVFAVGHRPRKFNPWIIHIHVLVLMLLSGYEIPRAVRSTKRDINEPGCVVNLQWDTALLQYFRSVPREQLPLPSQSLALAKGLILCGTTAARKLNPRIITVIQPNRPPRKFCPAKNTRYTVYRNMLTNAISLSSKASKIQPAVQQVTR